MRLASPWWAPRSSPSAWAGSICATPTACSPVRSSFGGRHVSPYEKGNIFNRDPMRTRKPLLHKRGDR